MSTGRNGSYKKRKRRLLERDGAACFFCGQPLGEDVTLEHLIPLTQGGPDNEANSVLAHYGCNKDAGACNISQKVAIAIANRVELEKKGGHHAHT